MKINKYVRQFFNTPTDGSAGGGVDFNPFQAADTAGHSIQPSTDGNPAASTSTQSQPGSQQGPTTTAPNPGATQPGQGSTGPGQSAPGTTQTQPAGAPQGASVSQQVAQPNATQPQGGVAMSDQQFQQFLQTVQGANQQGQANGQQTQLSPEEVDKLFAVVRPNEEQIAKIFRGGAEGVQTLTELLHSTAQMGATIASHHMVEQMNKMYQAIQSQFAPAREIAVKQQQDQHAQAFFTKYNGFTEADRPVLMSVYNNLVQQGFKGTPEQVYDRVANEATMIIKNYRADFSPVKPVQGGQATQAQAGSGQVAQGATQTQPQMASLVTTAGPGSGASTTQAGDDTQGSGLAQSIFGRLG